MESARQALARTLNVSEQELEARYPDKWTDAHALELEAGIHELLEDV